MLAAVSEFRRRQRLSFTPAHHAASRPVNSATSRPAQKRGAASRPANSTASRPAQKRGAASRPANGSASWPAQPPSAIQDQGTPTPEPKEEKLRLVAPLLTPRGM